MKNTEVKTPVNPDVPAKSGIKRRNFVKLLGGGIFIFFQPWDPFDILGAPASQERRSLTKDYNAFLHISPNGTINCYTGKIEMGQGIITSLVQMMADELNVQFEKVNIVMGDTELCPYDAGTWGSQTIQTFGPAMRIALAEARGAYRNGFSPARRSSIPAGGKKWNSIRHKKSIKESKLCHACQREKARKISRCETFG